MSPVARDAFRAVVAASCRFENLVYDLANNAAHARGVGSVQICDVQSALKALTDNTELLQRRLHEPDDSANATRRAG